MRLTCPSFVVLWGMAAMAWAADPTPTEPTASPPISVAQNLVAADAADQRAQAAAKRGDIPGQVAALNDEADARLRAHQFDAGEKLRLQVLHLEEDSTGRNSLAVSDALLNLGWFYANTARYEQAQSAFDRCLDIRQRLLGQEAAPVAEVLNAIGALEENRGNMALAEAFYQQAIAIQEKVLGKQSPVTATTWNNLATLYWITGDYASAQQLFAQALEVREKTLGPDSAVVAGTLDDLAQLDVSLGDFDDAENYFQRVLRIRTAKFGPDHPSTLATLSQLAQLYIREGDDARAEQLLERAVQLQDGLAQAEGPDLARNLTRLGMIYDRRKEYDKAGPLLQRALVMRRQILGDDHPEYAQSLAAMARHDHAQGRLADALPLYQQALQIDEDALGKNHPDTISVANDLAYLQIELRHPDDAMQLARDVAEAQQNMLNGVFTFAPERQRMDFERTIDPSDLPAALADPDLLAQVVLRTKGVVLDSLLEDAAVSRAERDPDVRDMMDRKRQIELQLSQENSDVANIGAANTSAGDQLVLTNELQQIESQLAEKGVGSGETRRALETEVSDVRDALPDDAALVEFVAYQRYTGRLTAEPAYGALVLTRDAPTQWVPLGSAADIETKVSEYQKYMQRRVRESALAEVLRGLYDTLCQPVVTALPSSIHRLIISPDGDLNFVSFATLLDAQDRFLAEDYGLSYVSSGRDLLLHPSMPLHAKRLVVFADPDYAHSPDDDGVRGHRRGVADDPGDLEPLPGTEREAAFLAQEAQDDGIEADIFRGAAASKANLAKQDSPYVLHLATHGLYLSTDDLPSLPPQPDGSDGAKTVAAEPMQRSLLALAGASVTLRDWRKGLFPSPDNDGLLTAQQVAALNLDGTWLVTLSACTTGGGEARAGEGVLGLRRGFTEAGAENLLMTLWTVDDAETADLMRAFYHDALHTGDAAGALADVQRDTLVALRKKLGLFEAVHMAGPFILSY